jgi:hypothetical protein
MNKNIKRNLCTVAANNTYFNAMLTNCNDLALQVLPLAIL